MTLRGPGCFSLTCVLLPAGRERVRLGHTKVGCVVVRQNLYNAALRTHVSECSMASAFLLCTASGRGRHIQRRVRIEETVGLEEKADIGGRHYGIVLWSGNMHMAEGVPEDNI